MRQTRVRVRLNGLRIDHFVKGNVDISAALAKVYKRILAMSIQVPHSLPGDLRKIVFLRKAVRDHSWAFGPLARVATAGLTFQRLYAEIEIAVQLELENVDVAATTLPVHPFGNDSVKNTS